MEYSLTNSDLIAWYSERGFGGRIGVGRSPALLVIDAANFWLDPDNPLGSEQSPVLSEIVRCLDAARRRRIPRIFTTMAFRPDLLDAGEVQLRKLPVTRVQMLDSPGAALHPDLHWREDEVFLVKQRQSAFFGTPLLSLLLDHRVDTLIVVGFSTSGCIRSTCESAFNYNFRVIVPREAVGDRSPLAHEANLFDIDNLFADVLPVAEALTYIHSYDQSSMSPRDVTTSAHSS